MENGTRAGADYSGLFGEDDDLVDWDYSGDNDGGNVLRDPGVTWERSESLEALADRLKRLK